MNLKCFLAAAFILGGSAWTLRASDTGALALPEQQLPKLGSILQQAVTQSPRMLSRVIDLEIAENDRIAARAGLLPSAGGSYRDSQARDDRADQNSTLSVRKVYYDFSITQPLFYWGERRNTLRMWEIRKKITEGQYQEGYRLLAQELRSKYLYLITQKIWVARARYNLQLAQEQLRIAEGKYAQKIFSDLDIFQPRLNAERAQIDVEHTEFEYENAKHSFGRLAGLASLTDDDIAEDVPAVGYQPEVYKGLLADFLAQKEYPSAEAVALRQSLQVGELDYRNQKTRLRPKFNLVMGANQDEQSYTLNTAQKYRVNSRYVGIALNWNIFDSFASQSAVRTSLARHRQMERDYAELNDRLAHQAQEQERQVYFAARSMSINDRFFDSAAGNLRAKQDEFKRGLISDADLSQVKLALFDARITASNSRNDFLSRVGEFLGTINHDPVLENVKQIP